MRPRLARKLALVLVAACVLAPSSGHTQEPQPGDSCSEKPVGAYTRSAGQQIPGGHVMVCDGSNWVSLLDYADSGRSLLQIDHDSGSCTSAKLGRLRYTSASDLWAYCDGASWIDLASGSGAAGSDRQVMFNSGGTMTGAYELRFMDDYRLALGGPDKNVIIGRGAAASATNLGTENTVVGWEAFKSNDGGWGNTALGKRAMWSNTSGTFNTAVGQDALGSNTTAWGNTALGTGALGSTTEGGGNVAVGRLALANNISGGNNTAVGLQALEKTAHQGQNVAFGRQALQFLSGGQFNVAVGDGALSGVDGATTGTGNVAVGNDAGSGITTGLRNIFIGNQAGHNWGNDSITTGDNNIIIGDRVSVPSSGTSYHLNIGDTLYGDLSSDKIGIGIASPGVGLDVAGVMRAVDDAAGCTATERGALRFNSAGGVLEVCDGGSWGGVGGGGSSLWTDNTTYISYQSAHFINSGQALPAGFDADGTRMFFYPDQGALRGGEISSNDAWQDTNIGSNSFAWGRNVEASGDRSIAMGNSSTASGFFSLAMGNSATASGSVSRAMGDNATASGARSTAMGAFTTASGARSTAMGMEVMAGDGTAGNGTGDFSVAFGLGDSNAGQFPQLTGQNAAGFFMGAQNNVIFASSNTLGIFGGRVVIDPADPATNLSANTALEVGGSLKVGNGGEACNGTIAGALRYNGGALELCDGASWGSVGSGGSGLWSDSGSGYIEYDSALGGMRVGDISGEPAPNVIGVTNLNDLGDVSVASPGDQDVLTYDTGTGEWIAGAGAAGDFVGLTDTPAAYTGAAGQFAKVNATPDGLEFGTIALGDLPAIGIDDLSDAIAAGNGVFLGPGTGISAGTNANVGVGVNVLPNLTSGWGNIAMGHETADQITTATQNTALGRRSLRNNTDGGGNTAVGASAMGNDGVADGAMSENTAVGVKAGYNITGDASDPTQNTLIGGYAGYNITIGDENTALGFNAMGNGGVAGDMDRNTAIGYHAGRNFEGGAEGAGPNDNVLLGYQAGDLITTGDANIMIGYGVDPTSATASNELNIGDTIYGDISTGNVGIGTASPDSRLDTGGGGIDTNGGNIDTASGWIDTNGGGIRTGGGDIILGSSAALFRMDGAKLQFNNNASESCQHYAEYKSGQELEFRTAGCGGGESWSFNSAGTGDDRILINAWGTIRTKSRIGIGAGLSPSTVEGRLHIQTGNSSGQEGLKIDLDGEASDIPLRIRTNTAGGDTVTDADTKFLVQGNGNVFANGRMQLGNMDPTWIDDTLSGVTDGIGSNDAALFAPVADGSAAELRLYLLDDGDEAFTIWGDSCAGGNCSDLDAASLVAKFQGNGNICGPDGDLSNCSSDARLKKNIEPLAYDLRTIRKLRPVNFVWNEKGAELYGYPRNEQQVGFVAQDIQDVIPDWVSKDKNGYYVVDDGALRYVLLSAVKQLADRDDALRAEIAALKAENEALKAGQDALRERVSALEEGQQALIHNTADPAAGDPVSPPVVVKILTLVLFAVVAGLFGYYTWLRRRAATAE